MSTKRPQFGCRVLGSEDDVFSHNTWDKFEWDNDMIAEADTRIEANSAVLLPKTDVENYVHSTGEHWNNFYESHEAKFFKDRHWLLTECPELLDQLTSEKADADSGPSVRILEVACGVGNTIFPLLEEDVHQRLKVFACDISEKAIGILTSCPAYAAVHNRCLGFVCDISDEAKVKSSFEAANIPENSLDFVTLVFALSAIRPTEHGPILQRLAAYLKPGGKIFFRDYCRYDLAQLRFKLGQCIGANHYVRRDGTLSYFFTTEEVEKLFTDAGLTKGQLHIDSRLIVNRKRRIRMYRMWLQGCFVKTPTLSSTCASDADTDS